MEQVLVVDERSDAHGVGDYMGQVKWFNPSIGYGFVTVINGDLKGKDIFCHHSGIKPTNSSYKTLEKGEYIQFDVRQGPNGLQADDITGILGGPLMCDCVVGRSPMQGLPPPPTHAYHQPQRNTTRYPSPPPYANNAHYVPAPQSAFARAPTHLGRAPLTHPHPPPQNGRNDTAHNPPKRPPKNKLKYSKEGREIMKAMKQAALAATGIPQNVSNESQ